MPNEYEIIADNVDVLKLYETFDSNSSNIQVTIDNKFYKFNFKIVRINSNANKLDKVTLKKILKKAKLIE